VKKIGLIGTGYWSQKHLNAWAKVTHAHIYYLCDQDQEKLNQTAQQFQIPKERLYTSFEEMLKNKDLDAVDIVTRPESHLALIQMAAEAGKHILCQKPLASSLEEAREMIEVVERCGVRLMVTENWRWLEPFQQVKRCLQQNLLGNIHIVRLVDCSPSTLMYYPERDIKQPYFREMPKFIFFEMGVHWFDVWRFLFGEPNSLYANISRMSPYIIGEDTGIVTINHPSFYGFLDTSMASRRYITPSPQNSTSEDYGHLVIEGDQATLILYKSNRIVIRNSTGDEKIVSDAYEWDMVESFSRLQSHFISCIEDGREFATSIRDNLKTLDMTFAVYESAKRNQVIHFNQDTPHERVENDGHGK